MHIGLTPAVIEAERNYSHPQLTRFRSSPRYPSASSM